MLPANTLFKSEVVIPKLFVIERRMKHWAWPVLSVVAHIPTKGGVAKCLSAVICGKSSSGKIPPVQHQKPQNYVARKEL